MFKRFKAVAVAGMLLVGASSSHAYWDYFQVIEAGSAEAKLSTDDGIKVRFGIMDNLEIMATMSSPMNMDADYSVGARYQIVPEMLSGSLDLGIPTSNHANFGVAPAVQFHMGLTDMIEFGLGAGLGLDINNPAPEPDDPDATEMLMHLHFGLEVGFALTESFGAWVGADFELNNLQADKSEDMIITPLVGITYTAGNLTVGTNIGINLDHILRDGEEGIGLYGAVDFSIRF